MNNVMCGDPSKGKGIPVVTNVVCHYLFNNKLVLRIRMSNTSISRKVET